ncbi:MAG: HlyD family type I secretion periplasmic adaptor subunit [Magnetococcus sp. DMHC-6]
MNRTIENEDFLKTLNQNRSRFGNIGSHLLLVAIFIVIVSCFVWAGMTTLERVTRGEGRVVPSRQVQVVSNLEGGIIKKVLVKEGQVVEEGAPMFELDQTLHQSSYNQVSSQILGLKAKIIRLNAEIKGKSPIFPKSMTQESPNTVLNEMQLYKGRSVKLEAEQQVYKSQIVQRRQELADAISTLQIAMRGLQLAQKESNLIKPLVAKGLEPEISAIQLDQKITELMGKKMTSEGALVRLKSAIQEVQEQSDSLLQTFRAEAMNELTEASTKLVELEQALPAYQDKVDRTEVRSPVRGVVNRILVNTVGGVIKAGDPIVEVVPLDDTLLVEAMIKPQDIGFLRQGQEVNVKFTAYDFAKFGGLKGTLENIGADAVTVKNNDETMFPIQIRTDSNVLTMHGKTHQIIPGMVVNVDIITGEQTVLEYLLLPLLHVKDMAFRE